MAFRRKGVEKKMSAVLPLQVIWREEETGSWFWTLSSVRRATSACSVPLYLSPDQDERLDALQHISLCPGLLREIAVHQTIKKDPAVDSHWRQFSAVNYIVCFKKKKKIQLESCGYRNISKVLIGECATTLTKTFWSPRSKSGLLCTQICLSVPYGFA